MNQNLGTLAQILEVYNHEQSKTTKNDFIFDIE